MIMALPLDIITDIFSRLPAKSLLRFKSVCKLWYNLISSPDFVKLHFDRSLATQSNLHFVIKSPKLHLADFDTFANPIELNYPFKNPEHGGVGVVGSCNGLLLLRNFDVQNLHHSILLIYNPTTQTYKLLPILAKGAGFLNSSLDYGFGYDSASGDYKCVRILQNFDEATGSFESEVMVYSLKDDLWRRGPDVPYFFNYHNGYCAVANDTLHWIGKNGVGGNGDHVPIVAFNLRDETFSSLPLPDIDTQWLIHIFVGVLEGCLCLLINYLDDSDVWVMKEYGVVGSWTRLFTLAKLKFHEELVRPICYSMSRKELFVETILWRVGSIDLDTVGIKQVNVDNFFRGLGAQLCVENLLMLEDGNDEVHIEMKSTKRRSKRRRRRRRGKPRA